jgi:hypothetical protein
VDNAHYVSGKKRSLDIDGAGDNNDKRQRNRRKSLNIRAEMTLLQDMVQERTEECARLKRVSAQLSVQGTLIILLLYLMPHAKFAIFFFSN